MAPCAARRASSLDPCEEVRPVLQMLRGIVDHGGPVAKHRLQSQSTSLAVDARAALKARFAFFDQVGAHRQYFG